MSGKENDTQRYKWNALGKIVTATITTSGGIIKEIISANATIITAGATIITAGAAIVTAGSAITVGFWQYGQKNESNVKEFKGRVSDARDGRAIRNVKVSLEGSGVPPVVHSDSEGVFMFPLEKPNTQVRVLIELDNYDKYNRFISTASNTGIAEIKLDPIPPIRSQSPVPTPASTQPSTNESPRVFVVPIPVPAPSVKPSPSFKPSPSLDTSPSTTTQLSGQGVLVARDDGATINIRSGPGKTYRNLHYGIRGDNVTFLSLDKASDGDTWYQIRFNISGADGWVHQDFIRRTR